MTLYDFVLSYTPLFLSQTC